jgi:asparagine N-glycosylation enzyme membrane subunit Stt3
MMNQQTSAPTSNEAAQDADFLAITVPSSVKVGGGTLLLLGVLTLVLCLQTSLVVRFNAVSTPIVLLMFGIGLAAALLGFYLTRGSGKAAVSGTVLAGVSFFLIAGWVGFSLHIGLLSLLAISLLPLSLLAATFCALSVSWARRADQARERLRAQGLDLGL